MNKEKIEYIIEKILTNYAIDTSNQQTAKREIESLIRLSNKEAVKDFVKYEEKEDETAGFPNGLHAKHLIIQESNREAIEKFRSFCEGEVYEKRLSDEHYVLVSILIDAYLSSIGKDK